MGFRQSSMDAMRSLLGRTPRGRAMSTIPLRAELSGDSKAAAAGIVARSGSPVLALCRELIAAGYDPGTLLEVYRGDTLCLAVRSIGEAAEVSEGRGFRVRSAPGPA